MPDNIQNTQTGGAELKDYYQPYNSTYEAIKRRRKKRMEKQGIQDQESSEFDLVPNPDL